MTCCILNRDVCALRSCSCSGCVFRVIKYIEFINISSYLPADINSSRMAAAFCTPPRVRKSLQGKRPVTDRKRVLFPTNSPVQSDDSDNLADSLNSSPSVYSPPMPSPSWSRTPPKNCSSDEGENNNFRTIRLDFNSTFNLHTPDCKLDSPSKVLRRSPRNLKSSEKFTNVDILTMLNSPEKQNALNGEHNISNDFITPKTSSSTSTDSKRKLQKSPILKPANFYGNSASLLSRNEANSVAGIKKIYRVSVDSKVKTKLFSDSKLEQKQRQMSGNNSHNKNKKPKEIFTGVRHSLKPAKIEKRKRSPSESDIHRESNENLLKVQANRKQRKQTNSKDKILQSFDFTRLTHSKQKSRRNWNYPDLKFTKPERVDVEGDSATKRKYFKTTLKSRGRAYFMNEISPPISKKRRLLNPDVDFLDTSQLTSASDILDLIEDGKVIEEEDKQMKEGVEDLILHLDDELEQKLPENICGEVSESDITTGVVNCEDNALNISTLSITDNCADVSVSELKENIPSPVKQSTHETPKKFYPLFENNGAKFADITNRSSGRKVINSGGKKWHAMGNSQYQIDAGQKRFGATECSTCGIVYQLGDPDDEIEHEKHHKNFKVFRHSGWQGENVVGQYGLDRVILVTSDNKSWWNKVLNILKIVDEEIGYTTEDHGVLCNLKVYLYIKNKNIAGCLVATKITHAYKMLISEPGIDICSEDSFPAKCGISRIWTHQRYRREGVASRLLESMRKSFYFGYYLSVDEFAFSAPTEDGKAFARKFTGKPDYLIYTGW